ncbi:DNA/RNA non-specific endonuclease [Spirochaeta cellobiosiphila]|uniref:DNA/RNA non-specific endonuclease n=1 Tax=Spirochaeta cellobiosiphila TaxID=504483 RepID=UPI00048EE425|nr:DNA/RNA non-specific endonuclease [Spirochaeta cellobiosiphila]
MHKLSFIGLVVGMLCLGSALFGQESEHIYQGLPSSQTDLIYYRKAYVIEWDPVHKVPRWVAYHVTPDYIMTPSRKGHFAQFRGDPDIDNEASEKDYEGQFQTWRNYAKGHLAPYYIAGGDRDHDGLTAADGDEDEYQTIYEINYMSNIAPQDQYDFNGAGGLWYQLETYVREDLIRTKGYEVWVYAGTIFGPSSYDEYKGISVPPLFYKIILYKNEEGIHIEPYLLPHQRDSRGELSDYLVNVDMIEALTGLDFYPEWDKEEQERFVEE